MPSGCFSISGSDSEADFGKVMKPAGKAIFLSLFLCACAQQRTGNWPVMTDQQCADNAYCSFDKLEPGFLKQVGGIARRKGETLTITLANGKSQTFKNNKVACETADVENCVNYTLSDVRTRIHMLAVQSFFYEGGACILIDMRTGRQTLLYDMPRFSPDENRFLLEHREDEYADLPDRVEIWRHEGDGAVLEQKNPYDMVLRELSVQNDEPVQADAGWKDDSHIVVTFTASSRKWEGLLSREGVDWRFSRASQ